MNQKLIFCLTATIVLCFGVLIYHNKTKNSQSVPSNFQKNTTELDEEGFSGAGKSLDSWSIARSYPSESIASNKFSKSHEFKSRLLSSEAAKRSDWEPLGPQNFAGRILTIAIDPNNSNTLYAGAASGGLWKSIDDGANWNYVSTNFPVLGVSSIAINPNNSNEIYIGTGEVYGDFDPDDDFPNQNTGQGYTIRYRRGTYGIGILKSNDGGLTWDYTLDWSQESELKGVNVLKISPFDADVLYAGTTDGLWLTTDGGENWSNILELPNVMSIALNPTIEGLVLAGVGTFESNGRGVYRSEDGLNFSPVSLPDYSGKAMLDFSNSNPDVAYASIGNYEETVGLFRSEDGGLTWTMTSDFDYAKYQGWYSHDVAIHPTNDSEVLVGGINVYRSTNQGQTLIPESDWLLWNLTAFPVEGPERPLGDFIHADIHDIVFHPTVPNKVYIASDGGVFKSENSGLDFISANSGLQTVQFYQNFSSSMSDENFAMGGLQDNATTIYRGNLAWERKIGGDGFGTIIDPNDDQNVWGSLYYLRLFYSNDKGHNFTSNSGNLPGCSGVDPQCYANFSAPIAFAPSSLNQRIYGGSNLMYKIENGTTRTVTNNGNPLDGNNPINCIGVSHQDENVVFAGTAPIYDPPAKLFRSENGGDNWTEVTNDLPDRFPMEIKLDPCDDQIVYVTFGGYDLESHLFQSNDRGVSWVSIGDGLPDVPTNAIFIDPENTNHIYVGNDIGVFATTDGGTTWVNYSTGLPDACIVMSLSHTPTSRKLRVATHGNGAYETDLLHQLENYMAKTEELGEWYVDDFSVKFEDEPNACIFQQCFYNIKDFDGTEWRSNNSRGFIFENFDQNELDAEWTSVSGDWQLQNKTLLQSNPNHQNTQLNISLIQTDSTDFLYHWKMKFEGNGNEKRAGVHIFADDLSQDFRGNSYLINFLENYDQVRIYKTDSTGSYNLLLQENVTIPPNQWMDIKVSYEPILGRISVFLDERKVAYVVAANPLLNGNGFSFRTGDAQVNFDQLTVFKGRNCSGDEKLVVSTNGDCRFESTTDTSFVCGIQSVGFSILRGWSIPDESSVKIGEHLVVLEGNVFTEDQEAVEGVDISFVGANSNNTLTNDVGVFSTNSMSGNSIEIIPEKLDNVKNGVNTFDLALVKRHILNLDPLNSPYKRIAADVNNSGTITTIDMVKMQLVILDFSNDFPGNTSWRFIPANYSFPSIEDWKNFPENLEIFQLTEDRNDANFIAIKVGDVNSSANLFQSDTPVDLRNNEFVKLKLENRNVKPGEKVKIPFSTKVFQDIIGYQMTINFDESVLGLIDTYPNSIPEMTKEQFGIQKIDEGKLLVIWASGKPISKDQDTELFYLEVLAKKEGQIKDALSISDAELLSEIYNDQKEIMNLGLEFIDIKEQSISNIIFHPNPFVDQLSLHLKSGVSQNVDISFYDQRGSILKVENMELTKGDNWSAFDFAERNYSGLIFYTIKNKDYSISGKLIKL